MLHIVYLCKEMITIDWNFRVNRTVSNCVWHEWAHVDIVSICGYCSVSLRMCPLNLQFLNLASVEQNHA